jgi:serine/threonine protein phosphatase PrpC
MTFASPPPAASPPAYETGAATHPGRVRSDNEDHFVLLPDSGVFAVADGMGGHEAGSLASSTVVDALRTIGVPASAPDLLARLEDRILRANARLRDEARDRGNAVVGSTVVALLVFGGNYAVLWSGDSRLYLVRDGRIAQLTRDHTEAQELVDKGVLRQDEVRTWPRRNVVTRAVGVNEVPELDIDHGSLQPGDIFVICSDGLTAHAADEEILARVRGAGAQQACDALIALALERGGTDNVTVLVVHYRPRGADTADAPEQGRADA